MRVVVLEQALGPLRQGVRELPRGGERRIEAEVQMNRADGLSRGAGPVFCGAAGQSVEAGSEGKGLLAFLLLGISGQVGLGAHKGREESGLVGGLVDAASTQALGAVCAQDREGHAGVVGLHDGRHVLAQGGTGGAHKAHRAARGFGDAESREGGGSLVHSHVSDECSGFGGRGDGVGQGRTAGARGHDNMPHSGANQRVEHGNCGQHGGDGAMFSHRTILMPRPYRAGMGYLRALVHDARVRGNARFLRGSSPHALAAV